RGGGRPRRPGRDHRSRPDRCRGHARGAEGAGRPPERRGGSGRSRRPQAGRGDPRALRGADHLCEGSRRPAARGRVGPGRNRPRPGRRRAEGRAPAAAPALARRRLLGEDRPLARGRGARGGAARPPRTGDGTSLSAFADQVFLLARRSVVRTIRQPANVVFPLVFPMLLLAVNSGGLQAETRLPGFPTKSFVAFALAVPFIQGALFATMNAGTDLARDIQTGFLNRLALTPLRGGALLAGHLGGVVALGVIQACFYLAVGLAIGVRPAAGVGGVALLFAFAILIALAFGALGTWAALRTGSGEAVQSLFPVFFVFLFLSSMAIPRNLISQTWFRD